MPRLPNITSKQLAKFFKKEGYILDHASGSHYVYYQPVTKKRAVIPMHNKDLPKGTLLAILRQNGYSKDDLSKGLRK